MSPRRFLCLSLLLGLALAGALAGEGRQAVVSVASPGAVTVREPAFGLPHIYADTDLELARENGREIAKDRLGQIILISRVARGTLYQAFGSLDASTLDNDVQARREGYTSSELNAMFGKLPADLQAYILAYCKGVNDTIDAIYAGTLPEPLEVNLLRTLLGLGHDLFGNATATSDQLDPYYKAPGGDDPEHPHGGFQFTPELATAIAVLQTGTFGSESYDEASRLEELNSLLEKFPDVGQEIWDDLNFLSDPLSPVSVPDPTTPGFGGPLAQNVSPDERPADSAAGLPAYDYETTLDVIRQLRDHRAELARSLGAWPELGSYAWMISSQRSATGNPWIGGFPQMGIQVPSIMHFVENRSAEGTDHRIGAIGMELVGGAFVIIGHTDHVAWTSTTAQLKNSDTVLEKLILEKTNSLRYDDEGTPAPMLTHTDQAPGPGGSTVPIVVWRTHERTANGKSNGGSRPVVAFQGDASGTADSATETSLTDAGAFGGDFSGGFVAITDGAGAGQMRPVLSATSDTLTLDAGDAWATTPDSTSKYVAVKLGNEIVAISLDKANWMEESTTFTGWTMFQRSESIMDIRRGARMMAGTHNFLAADNLPFDSVGTDLGGGNIGYWSAGFSRVRQGDSPTDSRLPMDGAAPSELVVVSGVVDSAGADTLTSDGAFGRDFAPPPFNFRMENPSEKGSEYIVTITAGDGYKQTRRIAANTADTLTLEEAWGVVPSAGDLFEVYEIVAMPEAINPGQGYTANWNNKAATADENDGFSDDVGRGFGREFRSAFIAERLAADSEWSRDDQRQLNKDVAGLDPRGKLGRYLIPRLREAVDGVGTGGNPQIEDVLAALEANNGSPYFGRYLVDPVTDTTAAGELVFLNALLKNLKDAIYGDELAGTGVDIPNGALELIPLPGGMSMASSVVQHAIDTAAGSPDGRYTQRYSGDYFNGTDWRVVVRDALAATIDKLSVMPADVPRPQEQYVHPLSALNPKITFPPTLLGNRGTWEQIVEAGPTVLGEFIFPLGQSGFIDSGGNPDPNFVSLHSIWGEWRFVPMLHIAEDLAIDPDGDVDNDGVLDGFEKWYFGSNSPSPTDDADGDGATLLDEFGNGLDPTAADTDVDGLPDGFELANACLRPQARDAQDDPDNDGLSSLQEYTDHSDPCSAGPAAPAGPTPSPGTPVPGTLAPATPTAGTPAAPPPSGRLGPGAGQDGGVAAWRYALMAAALITMGGLVYLAMARKRE